MRVSDQMRVRLAFRGLGGPRAKLGEAQEQVTSGRVINRPSDDPTAAAHILDLRETIADIEEYQNNAAKGRTLLGAAENAIGTAENIFARMGELAVQMSNGTTGESDRRSAAEEVAGAKEHIVDLLNSQVGDIFIFGGYLTQFDPSDPNPQPWLADGTFNGTTDAIEYDMNDGLRVPVTVRNAQAAFEGIWAALDQFETSLRSDDTAAIEADIDSLSARREQVDRVRAEVGTKLNRITFTEDVLDRTNIDVKAQLSGAEDADMLEVMARFRQEEIALQASLQMASRIFQPTLMDFLK